MENVMIYFLQYNFLPNKISTTDIVFFTFAHIHR